jgi:mannitol/fructose-specific phosphotransferase system IIA component (Ntr-type)
MEKLALPELLDARDVHLGFRAGSVIEAIPLLLGPALERRFDAATTQSIIDDAIKRELEGTTHCGALALPHARSAAVADFMLTMGANRDGVIEGQAEPRIIFAFISPAPKRQEHLTLLAALARLSQNPGVVRRLVEAVSREDVVETLRSSGI